MIGETKVSHDSKISKDEIKEKIAKLIQAFPPQTKESVRESRTVLLNQLDETMEQYLAEAETSGAKIDDAITMSVEFRYDRKLKVWYLEHLDTLCNVTLPTPLQRLYGTYVVKEPAEG